MPELTVRLLDGDSDRVLGKVGLTFSSQVREQLIIERLARLFDMEPLGGQLRVYVDQATAQGNAKALRQLCSGNNAGIDLPVKQRPAKVQYPESSPRSLDLTYQRIVVAVRTALNEAGTTPSIGHLDTDPKVFSSAVSALGKRVETYEKMLEQVKISLSRTQSSVQGVDAVPSLVREQTARLRSLEDQLKEYEDRLAEQEKNLTNINASLAQREAKCTTLQLQNQRLEEEIEQLKEESNRQHLAQPLADIDVFDDEPFPSLDQGAI